MQKSLTEQFVVSRPKRLRYRLPPLKQQHLQALFTGEAQVDRLATHLVILGLMLGLTAFGGIKLAQQQLQAPRYTPPQLSAEIEAALDAGRPLTLPNMIADQVQVLFPQPIPHTIIPDRAEPKVTTIQTYLVQPGDTVSGIAQAFGLAPETILWANHSLEDNPDLLRLGQALTILPVDGVYHQAGSGDTVEKIATAFKVSPETIINYPLNDLDPENPILRPGQWLVVPGGIKPYVPKIVSSVAVTAPEGGLGGTGTFQWPTSGSITQDFWGGHRALDIGAWQSAPVYAADAGYVVAAQGGDTG